MSLMDLVIIAILSIIVLISTAIAMSIRIRHKKSIEKIVQLLIDKSSMLEEIERLSTLVNSRDELDNGFIKFLSESREDAFSYISEVQVAIETLSLAIDLKDDKIINEACLKLLSFLPAKSQSVVE